LAVDRTGEYELGLWVYVILGYRRIDADTNTHSYAEPNPNYQRLVFRDSSKKSLNRT
jgi:hypothetical protein